MIDYQTAFNNLTLPERNGRLAIAAYCICSGRDFFSWNDVTALSLSEALCETPAGAYIQNCLLNMDNSQDENLNGITFWIRLYRHAQPWAWRLAGSYLNACDFGCIDDDFSNEVDEYISETANSCTTLRQVIDMNPLLHGAICIETSRHLREIVRSFGSN